MKPLSKSNPARESGFAVFRVPALAEWPWLVHGFSTRRGGVSSLANSPGALRQGGDLNLGKVTWDRARKVEQNRRRLLAGLKAEGMRLVVLNQIHSDLIRVFDDGLATAGAVVRSLTVPSTPLGTGAARRGALPGDGLVSNQPGLLLSVLVADCLPILVVDTRQRVVAALHCGWRGTARRLAQKAVGALKLRFASRDRDLRAAIGPGIRVCCYCVGEDVADEFASQFLYADSLLISHPEEESILEKKYSLFFQVQPRGSPPKSGRRIHLDLVQANVRQLRDARVAPKHIYAEAPCTRCHPELFFSHRRDAGRTGRMMGVIGIRDI